LELIHIDPDPGIFERFFNIARNGIFPQFGSYLLKKTDQFLVNFVTMDVSLDKVPVEFWKSYVSEVGIGALLVTALCATEHSSQSDNLTLRQVGSNGR